MWKRMGISGATKTVASRRKEVCFMVFKVFSQFIVLLLCLSISAAMPDQLSIGKGGGVFRIGGLEFRLAHFTPGYKQYTRQPGDAFFLPSPSMEWPLRFNGTFRTPTGVFKLTESFSKEGAATVRYEGRLDAAQAVASAELFLITTLPATEFAGENLRVNQIPLLLPARPEKPMRIVRNEVTELMIPLNHGTLVISGNNFRIQVADNRSSGRNTFTLRFYPICDQPGKIGNAEFSLAFNYRGINSFPLDLSRAANMDFADETPGDGKGGWTDQGPTNDLRMFQPGLRVFNGIKFQVIDPRKNHGKSCLVLRGENLPTLPDSAAIELPSNVRGASYLYLLHAAGWTKPHSRLGSVEITYPGQLRQREDLTVDIDAGNWWNPENLPNGTVVWRDHNDHAALGLYLTCIKLDRPDPVKILFRHGEGSLWMLVAASLADGAIRRPRPDEALFIVAGEKYVPIDAFKPIKAGTVLDLSSHTEKPAGKFGHIIATGNGHLAFEKAPGKRIRMFGTNLCGSACFPPRRYAPKLADELARMGYNSVRLHHIERELAEKGGKSSLEFSREKLDRLDWFVHCLKERGLYITIDLFSYRAPRPGELPSVSAQSNSTYGFKALLPFEEAVYQNWCDYVQNLLDHVNPYTGLRWADDPVLFCVNLVNEDSLPGLWRRAARNLFRKRYETYLEQRGIRTPENLNAVTGPYYEFLHELQARVIERLKHFVRTELKSKVLITDLNWYTVPYLSLMRGKLLDLVDNHQYTAHPSFLGKRWRLPIKVSQASSLSQFANNPRQMMPTRIFGKPFICTEYQFCSPNTSRTEAGALMGAYPALQDWDGLYRFAWSHGAQAYSQPVQLSNFDYSQSPERKLGEYLVYFQFLRGDVAAAPEGVAYPVDKRLFQVGSFFTSEFTKLGLFTRIGGAMPGAALHNVTLLSSLSGTAIPKRFRNIAGQRSITSSTGEITITKKSFQVAAPRFECVAGGEQTLRAKRLRLTDIPEFVTAAVVSLDKHPLAESNHMLFFCLVDIAATMQKFSSADRTTLLSYGKLPLLVRRMQPAVSISLPPRNWKLRRIDHDGTELGIHPSHYEDGLLKFHPDTGEAMVYEITKSELE